MSAFLCSDETLLVLVYSAMKTRHGLHWYWGPRPDGEQWPENRKGSIGPLDYDKADAVLSMLQRENRLSLEHRYPDSPDMWHDVPSVKYEPTLAFSAEPTAVEVLKTIACYEYQSCEHPGWHDSEAHAFCQALRHTMISELPGYDKATGWDWTPEEFKKRRGGCVSISGMIGRRK